MQSLFSLYEINIRKSILHSIWLLQVSINLFFCRMEIKSLKHTSFLKHLEHDKRTLNRHQTNRLPKLILAHLRIDKSKKK